MAKKELFKGLATRFGMGTKPKPQPKPTYTSRIKSPGTTATPGGVTPAAKTAETAAEQSSRAKVFQTLFGSKGRTALTAGGALLAAPPVIAGAGLGGGLYGKYFDLFMGGGDDSDLTYDPSKITTPVDSYNQMYSNLAALYAGGQPNQQAELDRLRRYQEALSGVGAAGGAGTNLPGSNVYTTQARAGLNAAAAGTGTATSGLTPVAGTVAAQADNLVAQGGTLQDYLSFMDRAADAAGLSRNSAARERLATAATNNFYKKQNAVQEKLIELEASRLQGLPQLQMLPTVPIDNTILNQAEALRKAGGNKAPIETYINQILLNQIRPYMEK